jgi:hypothetical protein
VLKGALADAGAGDVIHLSIDARFDHGLDVGPREATPPPSRPTASPCSSTPPARGAPPAW